jgi:hypothetical protein
MGRSRSKALLALSLFAYGALAASASRAEADKPALDVSANGPAFQALRRIQTRAAFLYNDQTFPQSVPSMVAWLQGLDLSRYDSTILLGRHPFSDAALFRWADTSRGNAFLVSPLAEIGYEGGYGDDTVASSGKIGLGARIHGSLGGNLSYYTRAVVSTEKTDRAQFAHQFDPEFGETYSVEKGAGDSLLDTRTYNRFEYYLRYDREWWSVKAGRDWIHSGPGYFSSLTMNRDTPPFYLIEGRIDFAPWLKLDGWLIKMTDSSYDVQKYANMHRLEFKPLASLALAYEDIVIYQDRDPDPAYLLPFVPLTFSEANSGGRDNAAMAFDAIWTGPRGFSAWGQLFLDDLLGPLSFFDDFWENRWASLAGFQWVLPKAWADADLVAEYTHVEPWTYTGRENHTSFKHYNVPSATKLGPDARSLDVQASWRPWSRMQWIERWEWSEKGLGRGATLGTIHVDAIDGQTKSFLKDSRSGFRLTHEMSFFHGRYLEARAWLAQGWGAINGDRLGLNLRANW